MGGGPSKDFGKLDAVPFVADSPFAEPFVVGRGAARPRGDGREVLRLRLREAVTGMTSTIEDAGTGEVYYENECMSMWQMLSKTVNPAGDVLGFARAKVRFMMTITYCLRATPAYAGQGIFEDDQDKGLPTLYRFFRVKVRPARPAGRTRRVMDR